VGRGVRLPSGGVDLRIAISKALCRDSTKYLAMSRECLRVCRARASVMTCLSVSVYRNHG
jgi:hypothetical protein